MAVKRNPKRAEPEDQQGYCTTCQFGPTPCDRRHLTGAQPEFREMVGEYVECREWAGPDPPWRKLAWDILAIREPVADLDNRPTVHETGDVIELLADLLASQDREMMLCLALDGKNRVIGFNIVSTGTLTASLVHPREVYKFAILANAASIVLAHNHPSGDPHPSVDDKSVTERMRQAGEIVGIKLLDHIVLADRNTGYSIVEG